MYPPTTVYQQVPHGRYQVQIPKDPKLFGVWMLRAVARCTREVAGTSGYTAVACGYGLRGG